MNSRAVTILKGGRVLLDGELVPADVAIEGDRVVHVGSAAPAPDARIVDVTSLSVLPGLIDVHTHPVIPRAMALYVLQGVTSVRFAGTPLGAAAELRRSVQRGILPGPRVFSCGPILDEPPGAWPDSTVHVTGPAEARDTAQRLIDAEADALLVAQRIRPATLAAITEVAHTRGVPVTGQTWTTSVREAVQAGMDGVENTARLPEDSRLPPGWVEDYGSVGNRLARLVGLWRHAPQASIDEVLGLMVDHGVDWAPEVCSFAHWAGLTDPSLASLRGWELLTQEERAAIPSSRTRTAEGWTDADRDNAATAIERIQQALTAYHRAGGPLAVGTDTHPGGLFYHLELRLLAQAGLSNRDVLDVATRGGARALRRDAHLGRVAAGMLADLIVVSGEPLKDLAALECPRHTIVGGRLVVRDGRLVLAGDSQAGA